jgi:hypothetical protein
MNSSFAEFRPPDVPAIAAFVKPAAPITAHAPAVTKVLRENPSREVLLFIVHSPLIDVAASCALRSPSSNISLRN